MEKPLANYLRTHRKTSALSQHELGVILGYGYEGPISRHERFQSIPPLRIAIAYEIVFGAPVSEIFAGLRETMEQVIEYRIVELEGSLGQRSARGPQAAVTARKLEWLCARKASPNPEAPLT